MAKVCNTCLTVTPATTRGKCPGCAQADDQSRRPSGWRRYPRGYRKNRAELLADQPDCVYCGNPADTADHLTPRVEGGTHDIDNLAPACATCNSRRGQGTSLP